MSKILKVFMKRRSDTPEEREALRNKIIGLGERSLRKSYYPQMQEKIDELEESRQKALENEKNFRTIFENAGDGILIVSPSTRIIILANNTFCRMLGYTADQLASTKIDRLHPQDEIDWIINQFNRLLSGEITIARSIPLIKKDGGLIYADITCSHISFQGMNSVIGSFRDVTGILASEKEKAEIQAKVQHSQKMEALGTLAGGISHDFNNILAAIIGLTETSLLKMDDKDPHRETFSRIFAASLRARDIIRQLLSISRQNETQFRPIDPVELLNEYLNLLKSTTPSTIEIKLSIKPGKYTISGDQAQIHQVLINLCSNAVHSMKENGGLLTISLRDIEIDDIAAKAHPGLNSGHYLLFEVSDTGEGIKPEILGRIFEPFFTTKKPGEGPGFGLSIVHGIIRNHGGAVAVYSEPGNGTTFRIFLPLIEHAGTAEKNRKEAIPSGSGNVLLVDDEEIIADVTSQILQHLGYNVYPFTESSKALELFRKDPSLFDIIITDMTMPGLTGVELAEKAAEMNPAIPVILCTGYNEGIASGRASLPNIKEVVIKPVTAAALAKKISGILKNP